MNTKSVVEYLHFLLSEISRIKVDWEISNDEVKLFNNELSRFKKLVIETENLSPEVIGMINKLDLIKSTRNVQFKFMLKSIFSNYGERNQIKNLKLKQNFELLENDLKRILNQIKYLSANVKESFND